MRGTIYNKDFELLPGGDPAQILFLGCGLHRSEAGRKNYYLANTEGTDLYCLCCSDFRPASYIMLRDGQTCKQLSEGV